MRVELQLHLKTQVTYFLSVVHFSIIQMIILNFSRTEVRIRERLWNVAGYIFVPNVLSMTPRNLGWRIAFFMSELYPSFEGGSLKG